LYEARRDRDLLSLRLEKLLKGEQVSDDDQGYVSVVESYLNKIRVLEEEVHEKKKGVSQLQIEYSRLYDAAERDAVILTKKTEKIFRLERKVKELEGMIKEMRDVQRV
jgi:CRISPR/Cas system CMR-associated protein Cmr5 small subunit